VSQQPISDGTDAIAALLAYGERMESDTPRTDANEWRTRVGDLRVVDADFARKLERELAAMEKQRDEQVDYSIALQRAIEHHRRGVAVPPQIASNCPHHAQMLNEHLAQKEGGGA
jgi:hypothetical protein